MSPTMWISILASFFSLLFWAVILRLVGDLYFDVGDLNFAVIIIIFFSSLFWPQQAQKQTKLLRLREKSGMVLDWEGFLYSFLLIIYRKLLCISSTSVLYFCICHMFRRMAKNLWKKACRNVIDLGLKILAFTTSDGSFWLEY